MSKLPGPARRSGRTGTVTDTVLLPDGRRLRYTCVGDPAGPPVLYFHGWPASRLEAALAGDVPVRLIAIDRPGFGGSSPCPGRRLLDWPADIAVLAAQLGLTRFHIVGVSGGAPYALACAAMLGGVAGTALVSPVPPLDGRHAPATAVLGVALRRLRQVGLRRRAGWVLVAAVRRALHAGWVDPVSALWAGCSARDRACITPALAVQITDSWREGLRTGVSGAVEDARAYVSDWGFELGAVRGPVALWHGTADRVVPVATLAAYASLPARRFVVEGEGTTRCR